MLRVKQSGFISTTNFFQWYTKSAQTLVNLFPKLGGEEGSGEKQNLC